MTSVAARDTAIDILKFLAVVLITWSHFDIPLGRYEALATGGAFGDTIFFFMSGCTLLLSGEKATFLNWYKRRINRIYPTVFAWALVTTFLCRAHHNIVEILLSGGGYFVSCIMVFYILFYPIGRFVPSKSIWMVMLFYFFMWGGAFYLIDRTEPRVIYNWSWSGYFLAMLLGAVIGKQRKEGKCLWIFRGNRVLMLTGLLISVIMYYALMRHERDMAFLAIINIIPLIGFTYFLYGLCCCSIPNHLLQKRWINWIVRFIGGLCLEVYIVQPFIISDKLNCLFPLNLIIIFGGIFSAAYGLRVVGRIWSQTFRMEDYNWEDILKPF